jgi:hypothetical protein
MITRILKAKHWQLFVILSGIPLLLSIITGLILISNFNNPEELNNSFLDNLTPIVQTISTIIYFYWMWSITFGLKNRIPSELNFNFKKFKNWYYAGITFTIIFTFDSLSIRNLNHGSTLNRMILIMYILYIYCLFYCLFTASKIYKSIILQKKVKLSEYIGEAILFSVIPIGIWIIQPKLNSLTREKQTTQ